LGKRVAFLSGGKDSLYAAILGAPVDLALVLVYEFPRPNPHLINLGKSVETLTLTRIPVLVARLRKGREREDTVNLLKALDADVIIAGDVYIEDHLRYMESLAREVGAELREPLWGMDPEELLYREIEEGIEPLIIGAVDGLGRWLTVKLTPSVVSSFVSYARSRGYDPLGERGEYHTLVLTSPLHERSLSYRVVGVEVHGGYAVALVV
jgi:uncharacterized protein (TIGR00290 family)